MSCRFSHRLRQALGGRGIHRVKAQHSKRQTIGSHSGQLNALKGLGFKKCSDRIATIVRLESDRVARLIIQPNLGCKKGRLLYEFTALTFSFPFVSRQKGRIDHSRVNLIHFFYGLKKRSKEKP